MSLFDMKNWPPIRELLFPLEYHASLPSPDGCQLLTFWQDKVSGEADEDKRLTVFDATTGHIIKRGSQLDGVLLTGSPAAWLPDGRYAYLSGNRLYVSSPNATSSELIATLELPGTTATWTKPTVFESSLAVSPDGSKLAFTWAESAGGTSTGVDIWVVNVDGTALRRFTADPDPTPAHPVGCGHPTWWPASRWIAGVLHMTETAMASVVRPDETVEAGF